MMMMMMMMMMMIQLTTKLHSETYSHYLYVCIFIVAKYDTHKLDESSSSPCSEPIFEQSVQLCCGSK